MKIAIMGTGGVGGYYGGLLAKIGHDVTFIARGAHLHAIREKGLKIKSVHGNFLILYAKTTDQPVDVGPVDLIIVATKTYHIDEAARAIKTMVGKDTVVIPLLNGIDAAERIGAVVGMEHMMGAATWLSASIEEPGVIGQYSQFHRIVLGEFNNEITQRLRSVYDVLYGTDVTVEMTDNIQKVLWTKFVFIASVMAIGSLTRVTFGEYRDIPEARAILTAAMGEVVSVAQAVGVALDEDIISKTLAFIDSGSPDIKPSMQRDIETGRPTELESIVGIIVRLGEKYGIPTPVMGICYGMLKPADVKANKQG